MSSPAADDPVALHFSPHPDDELIGAPAALMALGDAGWRVVNVACGLGRPDQRARREAELREACRRAGFELRIETPPLDLSGGEAPAAARPRLTAAVGRAIDDLRPRLVVSPGLDDRHPAHELVAGAVGDELARREDAAPRWWMWALWGALPRPTLGIAFDASRLERILAALGAHGGELERNDYRRLVRARAELSASLAPELLFGFGSVGRREVRYAELLTEVAREGGRWRLGRSRWLDPGAPLADLGPVALDRLSEPGSRGSDW